MAFLKISDLSKSFGTMNVLQDINLDIEDGEFVVFVGPSGCGKSTLLRMITGLETPTSGTIDIDGRVVNDVDPAQRGTSMVFQSYALYPHMTIFGNISFGLRMVRTAKAMIRERVDQAAGILRLDKLLERKPGQLSGGQKQRVAIGRAIVREPKIFLFDEPLSNLDAELRVQMRTELMDLHRRLQTTMIYVTHDQVEAMTLADKMVVLNAGKVQQVGPPLHLYDDPDNRFVACFVGSPRMNMLKADVSPEGRLTSIAGAATLDAPFKLGADVQKVDIGLRPEHLSILPDGASSPPFVLDGDVIFVEQLGDVSYVHLDLVDGTRAIVRADRQSYHGQDSVRITGATSKALLFDAESGRRLRPADSQ